MEGAVNPLGLDDRLVWEILARQVRRGRLSEVCAPRSAASACCGPASVCWVNHWDRASAGFGGPSLRRSYLAHLLAIRASSSACWRFES